MTTFAERQVEAWSAPPVDDVGYIPSAELLTLSDEDLLDVARRMRAVRYHTGGYRNFGGLWRDLMGLDSLAGKHILDFGCGTGMEACELAKRNHVSIADISRANIDLAARMLVLHGFRPQWQILVTMEPPYISVPPPQLGVIEPYSAIPPQDFDVFYCSGVLHHIPWARQIMERAHALLRPGGQARLMLYSDQGWRIATGTEPPADVTTDPSFERFVRHFDAVGEYADWYDQDRLEQRFGDLFTVERCEYMTPDRRFIGAVLRRIP